MRDRASDDFDRAAEDDRRMMKAWKLAQKEEMSMEQYKVEPGTPLWYLCIFTENTVRRQRYEITFQDGESAVGVPTAIKGRPNEFYFRVYDPAGDKWYRIPYTEIASAGEFLDPHQGEI